jgi:predicted nucleic acid-binding protein
MTLVDASSWIEFLRGRDSVTSRRVRDLLVQGRAAWCDITLVKLWHGTRGQHEKAILEELEGELPLCPVNQPVWARARKLARACREKGLTAPLPDIIIAACAVENKIGLEHQDPHFDLILPLAQTL